MQEQSTNQLNNIVPIAPGDRIHTTLKLLVLGLGVVLAVLAFLIGRWYEQQHPSASNAKTQQTATKSSTVASDESTFTWVPDSNYKAALLQFKFPANLQVTNVYELDKTASGVPSFYISTTRLTSIMQAQCPAQAVEIFLNLKGVSDPSEVLKTASGGTFDLAHAPTVVSTKSISVSGMTGIERVIKLSGQIDQVAEASLVRTDSSGKPWGVYLLGCSSSESNTFETILNSFAMR